MNTTETLASLPAPCGGAPYRGGYRRDDRGGDGMTYLMKQVVVSIARQANKQLDAQGLTLAQWALLMKLRDGGPWTAADLARDVQIDAGAMTRLLDRLEKKNYCRRTRSSLDRRVVRVESTREGDAAVAQVRGLAEDVSNAHLAGFTSAESRALRAYLQRMLEAGAAMRERA